MPESNSMVFSYKEVAKALIREGDIHEGLWGLYVKFGIAAANIGAGPNEDLKPSAIVPILELGIQKFTKLNSLTVDAAEVNPKPRRKAKKKKKS